MGRIFHLVTLFVVLFLENTRGQRVLSLDGNEFETALDFPKKATWAVFGETYHGRTPHNASLVVYRFHVPPEGIVRFKLSSNAAMAMPLMAVFRQVSNVISAQLPIKYQNYIYNNTARTLCPLEQMANVTLSVEMSSFQPVNYEFSADLQKDFYISMDASHNLSATASEPLYVRFDIPEDLDSVVVRVESQSTICMTVSVQPVQCPVFDMESNVLSMGMHQTMSTSASITVERTDFLSSFNLVFVVRQDDNGCSEDTFLVPIRPIYVTPRLKNFTVTIDPAPTMNQYLLPVFVTIAAICLIYIIAIAFVIAMGRYEGARMMEERQYLLLQIHAVDDHAGPSHRHEVGWEATDPRDDSSLESYDLLVDIRDKEVVRANVRLTVADLSMKTWKQRDQKYRKYTVSLITLCLFYGLPVVQLVLNWQDSVRQSGNLDLCWYNFACSRPFLIFFNFNNILSNIGYVSLGLLFLFMVKERDHRHANLLYTFPEHLRNEYGLPRHNGLLYAMGIACVMEGVLSASYHICPSSANYQFDTSFMYMIGMLGILQIYQLRHPDINANAHVSFALMAFSILVAMIGVYWNTAWFWIIFSLSYVVTMFTISIEFYFKGQWEINMFEMWRGLKYAFVSSRRCSCLVPTYKGRFFFLILANAINFGYIAWGVLKRPRDFPSFLLLPFIANLFLYLTYYIVMKFVHREHLRVRAVAYLAVALLCWIGAVFFFLHNVSDWSETPASSRELNRPCILLGFYDNHDVWHFLSALGIFLSFSLLLSVDDDLIFVRRDRISVF